MMQKPYQPTSPIPVVTPIYAIDQRVWLHPEYDANAVQLSFTAAMMLMVELIHRKIAYTVSDLDGDKIAAYSSDAGFDGPQEVWDQMAILSAHVDRMVKTQLAAHTG